MARCIMVLGVGRSGTSAVAGALHKLGVNMGDSFVITDNTNPLGTFEDEDVFKQLPGEIRQHALNAETLPGTAVPLADAIKDGWLIKCEPFDVVTLVKDGKKTKKAKVIMRAGAARDALSGNGSAQAGSVGSTGFIADNPAAPREFRPIPLDETAELFAIISAESLKKLDTLRVMFARLDPESGDDVSELSGYEWERHLFDLAWYDSNKNYFQYVRDTLTQPAPQAALATQAEVNASIISDGERANFLSDLALHSLVPNEEYARGLCKSLGIEGSSQYPNTRVQDAKRIWLLATLINSPHGMPDSAAVLIVLDVYPDEDEVPF